MRAAWRDGRSAALVVLYNVCVGGRWRSRRGLQPIHWMRLWDAWAAAFNKWILARTQDYGGVQKWNYVNTHQSSDARWIWICVLQREVAIDWKIRLMRWFRLKFKNIVFRKHAQSKTSKRSFQKSSFIKIAPQLHFFSNHKSYNIQSTSNNYTVLEEKIYWIITSLF